MKNRIVIGLLITILLVSVLAGCGKSASDKAEYSQGAQEPSYDMAPSEDFSDNYTGAPEAKPEMPNEADGGINIADIPVTEHKIIFTADMALETLNFDNTVKQIEGHVQAMGGYTEQSNIEGKGLNYKNQPKLRTARFTFRVPKKQFEQFLTDIRDYGSVTSESSQGQNITDQYFDTEGRLKSLKIQEDRILTILEKAERLQDILELERELSNIRYQIESLTGTLKKWDNLVDYATVHITVYEVEEIKPEESPRPKTLWDKMVEGFGESLEALSKVAENIVLFLVVIFPFVIVFGGITLVILWIIKRVRKK